MGQTKIAIKDTQLNFPTQCGYGGETTSSFQINLCPHSLGTRTLKHYGGWILVIYSYSEEIEQSYIILLRVI
jgi:hypothetical protein